MLRHRVYQERYKLRLFFEPFLGQSVNNWARNDGKLAIRYFTVKCERWALDQQKINKASYNFFRLFYLYCFCIARSLGSSEHIWHLCTLSMVSIAFLWSRFNLESATFFHHLVTTQLSWVNRKASTEFINPLPSPSRTPTPPPTPKQFCLIGRDLALHWLQP